MIPALTLAVDRGPTSQRLSSTHAEMTAYAVVAAL